jgi:pyruvate/2-oxoglutarate/acetoin dehydrogenase E1 component
MAVWRPVCEMQYDAFSYPVLDQLITHVGRYRWRTGGQDVVPARRAHAVRRRRARAELHDDSPETYYVHTPGVKVAIPSHPSDAKGPACCRDTAIRIRCRARAEAPLPHAQGRGGPRASTSSRLEGTLGARGRRPSRSSRTDRWFRSASRRQDALENVSVEVLDIRTLKPLDEDALLTSAAKTGRVVIVQEAPRFCGFAAELAAILARRRSSTCAGRFLRVTGYDVPYPYWQIEDAYMPSVERVTAPSGSCSISERLRLARSRRATATGCVTPRRRARPATRTRASA